MKHLFDLKPTGAPVVIVGFQGWNDPAGASLAGIDHLRKVWDAKLWAEYDPEPYYDFQVTPPLVEEKDGERTIVWRTTSLYHATVSGLGDVILVRGIEPSFRWPTFLRQLWEVLDPFKPSDVIVMGAIGGEVPHTRPLPATITSPQESTRVMLNAQRPNYTGPIGIVGVIIDQAGRRDLRAISIWVTLPHYATGGQQPKAATAFLEALSSVIPVSVASGDLEEEGRAWERGVDELVAQDPAMRSYVEQLEQRIDVADLPQAQGEAIADAFEKYLRGREGDA